MTPERLNWLIDRCFEAHGGGGKAAHYRDIARFLEVEPITLRRWLRGRRPIPRHVEIIMEIFFAFPEVTAAGVEAAMRRRDGGREASLDAGK
jgi:hypothetical protein